MYSINCKMYFIKHFCNRQCLLNQNVTEINIIIYVNVYVPLPTFIVLLCRKSKWDQPAPGVTNVTTTAPPVQVAKTTGLVQPTLTTNATGTKGTVISAFGSLPKKPKV